MLGNYPSVAGRLEFQLWGPRDALLPRFLTRPQRCRWVFIFSAIKSGPTMFAEWPHWAEPQPGGIPSETRRTKNKQNPGFTDQKKKRENERAGQNPYDKDQASTRSDRRSRIRSMIRAIYKTIPIARPIDRVSVKPRWATGGRTGLALGGSIPSWMHDWASWAAACR